MFWAQAQVQGGIGALVPHGAASAPAPAVNAETASLRLLDEAARRRSRWDLPEERAVE